MRQRAAIIGVGQTPYRTYIPEMTYPELVRKAAQEALAQANMDLGEIEAVVVAMAPTGFMGVNDPEKWVVEALGAQGKPLLRVHTGGATGGSAAQAGYFHVASGLYNAVLVVGADKVGETPDAQLVLNTIWDPIYEKDFALNAITMTAFQAARHMHKYGTTERQMALVAVRCRANATRNPYAHLKGRITVGEVLNSRLIAWPLKLYDCCPRSSGGAAVVVVSEPLAREKCSRPAWITGVGAVANTVFIGDRMGPRADTDYGDWNELAMAARQAFAMAGIKDPAREISVAEIYAPFTSTEIAAVEALGFCPKGQGGPMNGEGMFEMDGALPVNPSGGTLCANPIAVTALVRVCDAALQVMGCAGDYQVKGVRHAVATGIGGSLQFHTCMVLSTDYR